MFGIYFARDVKRGEPKPYVKVVPCGNDAWGVKPEAGFDLFAVTNRAYEALAVMTGLIAAEHGLLLGEELSKKLKASLINREEVYAYSAVEMKMLRLREALDGRGV